MKQYLGDDWVEQFIINLIRDRLAELYSDVSVVTVGVLDSAPTFHSDVGNYFIKIGQYDIILGFRFDDNIIHTSRIIGPRTIDITFVHSFDINDPHMIDDIIDNISHSVTCFIRNGFQRINYV